MTPRMQFEATLTDPQQGRFARVTLEDAIGVSRGPRAEQTALRVRAFENQHDVLERYFGTHVAVGVALLRDPLRPERDVIRFAAAPDVQLEQSVEELLFRAATLYSQVHLTFEDGRDRALCLHMVYGVIAGLFKELDRAAAAPGEHVHLECTGYTYLEKACTRAEMYFRRAAQRRAQARYLAGMLGGLAAIILTAPLFALGLEQLPAMDSATFIACLIGGGAGALLSVLFGMTSGNLRLHTLFANAESGFGPLVAAGALRPLLGALSGTVVFVLLQSGLVPLEVPKAGNAATNFYLALAIVAGFSERWARGVLAGTEERLAGGSGEPQKGSSTGASSVK